MIRWWADRRFLAAGTSVVIAAAVGFVLLRVGPDTSATSTVATALPGPDTAARANPPQANSSVAAVTTTSAAAGTMKKPLPPAGTSLRNIQSVLAQRASNGDAAAASRLFRDTLECRHVRAVLESTKQPAPPGRERESADYLESELERVRKSEALCAGLETEIDDGRIYSISLQAAQLGDADAACFYVNAPLLVGDGRLSSVVSDVIVAGVDAPLDRRDQEIVAQYLANVAVIGEAGIERGDWNIVEALSEVYSDSGWLVVASPVSPDPLKAYRYRRLWRLGESDPERLRRFAEIPQDISDLDPAGVMAANLWAQETYRRYFSSRPPLPEEDYALCGLPPLHGLQ